MQRAWVFETVGVTAEVVDFSDPALSDWPDVRERGVRLELCPVLARTDGSIYASAERTLLPAVVRIDLLESRPGAADRMHWHPVMVDGEPGDRTFDEDMPADTAEWLLRLLRDVGPRLRAAGLDLDGARSRDVRRIASAAEEITGAAMRDLESTRAPWPVVQRDDRGLAV